MQLHRAPALTRSANQRLACKSIPTSIRVRTKLGSASSTQLPLRQPYTFGRAKLGGTQFAIAVDTVQAVKTLLAPDDFSRTIRVYYSRRDKRYQGYGLHIWGDVNQETDWQTPLQPSGQDDEGIWFDVPLKDNAQMLGLEVHAGDMKSARAEVQVAEITDNNEIWLAGDEQQAFFNEQHATASTSNQPVGTLAKQSAIWLTENIIAWRHDISDSAGMRRFFLHANPKGHMWVDGEGVQGSTEKYELQPVSKILPSALAARYPYLGGCAALRLPPAGVQAARNLLRGQLAITMTDPSGKVMDTTGLQIQGALDAYFKYDGELGCFRSPETQKLTVAVWAPSAQAMQLLHYEQARGGPEKVLPMELGKLGPGVWSAELPDEAMFTYYKYRVTVYHNETRRMEVSDSTDPYSRSLAADGERTQVVLPDINDAVLKPDGWDNHKIPPLERWTDISLYELHIRDFSSQDKSVKPEVRGKYLAFDPEVAPLTPGGTTHGLTHLSKLREAGLNTLHLMPTYDFASTPERKEDQKEVTEDLSKYAPDGEEQQRAVLAVADRDAFNWGYDPAHFGVPEGSYATDPDGEPRIRQFRQMVMALHKQGWRVVLDVVYNHLYAGGPQDKYSVLDKIVPGYYYRRNEDGSYCGSFCCGNMTASEYHMCERLIVDDIVHWAEHYKIDGFRFDIMGHLLVSTLEKIRSRFDALTPEKNGVDGKKIYIYGEAWEFGEVMFGARGLNCQQLNLAGTKLGSFNDRLRDPVLGGGPFVEWNSQGFATGLSLAPNGIADQGDAGDQRKHLLTITDSIRWALAGNLRQYMLETFSGEVSDGQTAKTQGTTVLKGLPLAYNRHPCEHVAFVGCHDHVSMFDQITQKAPPEASAEERMRMQVLGIQLILMSQGIPFIHAGDELLRSKSLDYDSYNSGDWFNGVDWTGETHKLGIGLPPATKNADRWHYQRGFLTNEAIRPTPALLKTAAAITQQFLRIRYSSPLFRLPSADAIMSQVLFHNTGPNQVPGVILMEILSAGPEAKDLKGSVDGTDIPAVHDPNYERIVVVFNAAPDEQEVLLPSTAGLVLHPLQDTPNTPDPRARKSCVNTATGKLTVPARTTAVFVQPRQPR